MNLASSVISIVVGLLIPGLVAVVTRSTVTPRLKSFLGAVLAAANGIANGLLSSLPHGWHQWETVLIQFGLAVASAGIVYLTGYRPTGLSAWLTQHTESIGLGPSANT